MNEFKEEVKKLNNDEQFKYFLTDEEDGENLYESGLIIAKKEGLEQGMQKGSKEATLEIAKEMLKDKISINKISEYTNLSIQEINFLKNHIQIN